MWGYDQSAISDAAFAPLRGIHTLVIDHCAPHCEQATLTGAGFAHLQGISALGMYCSRPDLVAAARGLGLPVYVRGFTFVGALRCTFRDE